MYSDSNTLGTQVVHSQVVHFYTKCVNV